MIWGTYHTKYEFHFEIRLRVVHSAPYVLRTIIYMMYVDGTLLDNMH